MNCLQSTQYCLYAIRICALQSYPTAIILHMIIKGLLVIIMKSYNLLSWFSEGLVTYGRVRIPAMVLVLREPFLHHQPALPQQQSTPANGNTAQHKYQQTYPACKHFKFGRQGLSELSDFRQ